MIWTSSEVAAFLRRYAGQTLLGVVDGGDCLEIVFSESPGGGVNLLCLFESGKVSHGGVGDPAAYARAHGWSSGPAGASGVIHLAEETRIVWLEDVARLDYVRESVVSTMRYRGRPGWVNGRLVGYAELARADHLRGRHKWRRVFWLKSHDRDSESSGVYRVTAPAEAVDPRTVAPGVRGVLTARAWGRVSR